MEDESFTGDPDCEYAKRYLLLERLNNFVMVPGHGPDIENMSNEDLELYVKMLERLASKAEQIRMEG
ncbi:hypothetical protein [Petroclostridium sp. X23]|uniref:hypothetical protein n=1 Tax=Petroclostridium sp. X23 TaxID=3045146 RepID=UPI0024ADF61A|nr:hypothetical protein [Petroclostridium sp. X23]WHH59149.1 hypothetical protein QKW49_25745 [Petroclostridium sp. X23]